MNKSDGINETAVSGKNNILNQRCIHEYQESQTNFQGNFLETLDTHIFEEVLKYLTFSEIFLSVMLTNKSIHRRLSDDINNIAGEKVIAILNSLRLITNRDNIDMQSHSWNLVAKHISPYPTDFDFESLFSSRDAGFDKIIEVSNIPGQSNRCIAYQGLRRGGNRCVIGNCHFPTVAFPVISLKQSENASHSIIRSQLPFVKTFRPSETKCELIFSHVAYFEIKIFDPIPPLGAEHVSARNWSEFGIDGIKPCVCIGICLAGFNVGSLMPGWRANSFGYHGDDGSFFHGSSSSTSNMEKLLQSTTFGAGDIVGCGILYPPYGRYRKGGIFYTKNGELVAEYSFRNVGILANAWYPVVGSDCYNPIEMNCGQRPFQFPILSYELNHLNVLYSANLIDSAIMTNFHMTGQGLRRFLHEGTIGYNPNYVNPLIHPAVKNPWKYVGGAVIPAYKEIDMSSATLSDRIHQANLSFFSGALYRETRNYNRNRPDYVESYHDIYGDFLYVTNEDDELPDDAHDEFMNASDDDESLNDDEDDDLSEYILDLVEILSDDDDDDEYSEEEDLHDAAFP